MILFGGNPERLTFGPHGITPSQIVALGGEDSPLLDDIDPGDELTELLWVLLTPLPASGTTEADDFGYYALIGPAAGTWEQDYRVLSMPATGAPYAGEAQITTTVAVPAAVTLPSVSAASAVGSITATSGSAVTLPSAVLVGVLATAAVGTITAVASGVATTVSPSVSATAAVGIVRAVGDAPVVIQPFANALRTVRGTATRRTIKGQDYTP